MSQNEKLKELENKYKDKLSKINPQKIDNALNILKKRRENRSTKDDILHENLDAETEEIFELMEKYRQDIKEIFMSNNEPLFHITGLAPENIDNNYIKKSINCGNNYETEFGNWVFASSDPVDGNNPYIGRKFKDGMIYLGNNTYIFGGDNMEVSKDEKGNNHVLLKEPNYVYRIKPENFLPVVTLKKDKNKNPFFEFSKEWISDKDVSIKDDVIGIEKITDITSLLEHFQVFCDVKNQRIARDIRSCHSLEESKEKMFAAVHNNSLRYINAEAGINKQYDIEKDTSLDSKEDNLTLRQKLAQILQKQSLLMKVSFIDKFVHKQLDILPDSDKEESRGSNEQSFINRISNNGEYRNLPPMKIKSNKEKNKLKSKEESERE